MTKQTDQKKKSNPFGSAAPTKQVATAHSSKSKVEARRDTSTADGAKKRVAPTAKTPTTAPTVTKVVTKKLDGNADKHACESDAAALPIFPYFPVAYGWVDDEASGASASGYTPAVFIPMPAEMASAPCECCGRVRSHMLDRTRSPGLMGTKAEVAVLCPWCVADGSAARRYNGCFITSIIEADDDDETQNKSKVNGDDGEDPAARYQKLMECTPGFNAWTGCQWATHCGDACAYHGELRLEEITTTIANAPSTLRRFARENPELFAGEGEEEEEEEGDAEEGDAEEEEEVEEIEEIEEVEEVAEEDNAGADDTRDAKAGDDAVAEEEEEASKPFVLPPDEEIVDTFLQCYDGPGSDPAVYKFVCRHCGEIILNCDYL